MKVISVVGYKKTGKTTLVERLVSGLTKYGRVGTVKHTREEILPILGDTERHRASGASEVIGITPTRSIKINIDTSLKSALDQLSRDGMDFAVVEGFKESGLPKIAIGDVEAKNVVARVDINAKEEDLVKIALEQPEHITLEYLIAKAKSSPKAKESGAIGTFTGIVREVAKGEITKALEFESYNEIAASRIKAIEDDLRKREGIQEVLIYHKTGRIEAGEDIVFIVVLAAHREELFLALREAIERIKDEVPIWKKELTLSGDFWVHDKGHDK
jgi:molybdopterin synthase catalytic subunit